MCRRCDLQNPLHPNKGCFHTRSHPEVYSTDFHKSRELRKFFPVLRSDFRFSCCYCTLHERELGSWEDFESDHFIPRRDAPHLETIYTNLYYSCRSCNGLKRAAPSGEFVDPCTGELHAVHILESEEGMFVGQTPAGKQMVQTLRLGGKRGRSIFQRHLLNRRKLEEKHQENRRFYSNLVTDYSQLLGIPELPDSVRIRLENRKREFEEVLSRIPSRWKDMLEPPPFP